MDPKPINSKGHKLLEFMKLKNITVYQKPKTINPILNSSQSQLK